MASECSFDVVSKVDMEEVKNAVTMAEVFQRAGYATYMTGKWHIAKS